MVAVEVAVVVLATARLVRLVTTDEITRRPRQWIAAVRPDGSLLVYLVGCRWCASIWLAAVSAAGWWAVSNAPRWSGRWWVDIPTAALAMSYAVGLLVRAEPQA